MEEEEEAMRRFQSAATGAASGGVRACACVCMCVYVPLRVCARVRASVLERGKNWLYALCCIGVRARACARVHARACFGMHASQDCFVPRYPHHVCVYVCICVCLSLCGLLYVWMCLRGRNRARARGGIGRGGERGEYGEPLDKPDKHELLKVADDTYHASVYYEIFFLKHELLKSR